MIYALIVIYNKVCEDSQTINSIYKWKDHIQLVVFDNSTTENKNSEYCRKEGILYFSKNKNLGLSKAYNYAIDHLPLQNQDYIMVLDDDTCLNDAYVEEVLRSINLNYDVLLPVVRSGNIIISPTNIKFKCGSKIVDEVGQLDKNHISAINSGMVVSSRVYEKIRYNEELFLDCIDHEFMRLVRNNKCSLHILTNGIVQNFSRNEKPKIESALFRFKLYKKDFKKYCEINHAKVYYVLSISKFILAYSLKYKSLKFLKAYFEK